MQLLKVSLLFFVIIMVSEDLSIDKLKREIIIYSTCLILFIEFLIYKKAFLVLHGLLIAIHKETGEISSYRCNELGYAQLLILRILISQDMNKDKA